MNERVFIRRTIFNHYTGEPGRGVERIDAPLGKTPVAIDHSGSGAILWFDHDEGDPLVSRFFIVLCVANNVRAPLGESVFVGLASHRESENRSLLVFEVRFTDEEYEKERADIRDYYLKKEVEERERLLEEHRRRR